MCKAEEEAEEEEEWEKEWEKALEGARPVEAMASADALDGGGTYAQGVGRLVDAHMEVVGELLVPQRPSPHLKLRSKAWGYLNLEILDG